MQPITRSCLRAPRGWRHNRIGRLYLPVLDDRGNYVLPGRDSSLLNLKVRSRRVRFSKGKTDLISRLTGKALISRLCTDLGISKGMSEVVISRPRSTIERIEEEIKGIIDSLLLFDSAIFIESDENKTLLFTLLRKVISVGAFDVDDVTKDWKEFTTFVWARASRSKTIEEPTLRVENIFKRCLAHSSFLFIEKEGIRSKRDAEALAHLTSSRQLVAGGRKTMKAAMQKFIDTTSVPFGMDEAEILRLSKTAEKVGRKIRSLSDYNHPLGTAHISLSGAGSFSTTVKDGGRAQEIIKDISSILKTVPEGDTVIQLPYGFSVKDQAGRPRWTTWCRETPIEALGEFGELRRDMTLYGEYDRRWGFDNSLGDQIFICALICAAEEGYMGTGGQLLEPIPARSICVPEPGGKSRIVTTTTWWNIILQQPAGHFFKKVLEHHPSADAGLQRADQAWLYLDLLRKADIPKGSFFLSSDLEEATDSTPQELIGPMMEGFCRGLGITDPLLELGINLAKSSRAIFTSDKLFIKKRGSLMGEPLTKTILTVLNLCTEEAAIRDFVGDSDGPIQLSWRAFAVGGDDHVAVGPLGYLDLITDNHLRWGSKISKRKHGISCLAVKYCEKVLYLKEADFKISARLINESTENYERSPFVDSVKVRLLSPISKSIEVQNDRNIAIGKAKSLGRTLRWLNPDIFKRKWVEMVRKRFFRRMKHYLPKEDTSLYYQVLLPEGLGGLDLWLKGEFLEITGKVPIPTRQYISKLLSGDASLDMMRKFKTLTSNSIERGYDFKSNYAESIETHGFGIEGRPVYDIRDQLGLRADMSLRLLLKSLSMRGWKTFDDVLRTTLRGVLFEEILKGSAENRKFSTTPWKKRYALLWDRFYDPDYKVIPELNPRLKELEDFSRFLPLKVYNVREDVVTYSLGVDGETEIWMIPFEEEVTKDLPNLRLSRKVGLSSPSLGEENPNPAPKYRITQSGEIECTFGDIGLLEI